MIAKGSDMLDRIVRACLISPTRGVSPVSSTPEPTPDPVSKESIEVPCGCTFGDMITAQRHMTTCRDCMNSSREPIHTVYVPNLPVDNKQYLGDSVYCGMACDHSIVLTTENGPEGPSNRIVLEPAVVAALLRYLGVKPRA